MTTTQTTLYKQTRFDAIAVGTLYTLNDVSNTKVSARKNNLGTLVAGNAEVTIVDTEKMAAVAVFLAQPLFDGTEASCTERAHYYALEGALRDVVNATEKLDDMCDYVARKMADVKQGLRNAGAVDAEVPTRYNHLTIAPSTLAGYASRGLNSCGELQGNGNVDMLVVAVIGKREAFQMLARALGYRLTNEVK